MWNAAASILAPPQKEGNAWQAQGNREAGERSGTDAGRTVFACGHGACGFNLWLETAFQKKAQRIWTEDESAVIRICRNGEMACQEVYNCQQPQSGTFFDGIAID